MQKLSRRANQYRLPRLHRQRSTLKTQKGLTGMSLERLYHLRSNHPILAVVGSIPTNRKQVYRMPLGGGEDHTSARGKLDCIDRASTIRENAPQ
jgi:hypothetical protein